MRKHIVISYVLIFFLSLLPLNAQEGFIPEFKIKPSGIALQRMAKPGIPFDKVGRKFAILGEESGSFEAWAYPLKLFWNFEMSFFLKNSTRPILASDIIRIISVSPEATILTYTYQSFTVKAIYITPLKEPGAFILLEVDSVKPLNIVCGFIPVLQPMWPAGIGGQYAYWDSGLKAYIISESTGQNHGLIGSPAASGISSTPAHMLSDTPTEFKIEIPDPEKAYGKYIPICMAGGKGPLEEIKKIYKKLEKHPKKYYKETLSHYQDLRQNTLQVQTPHPQLNLAFEWAKVAFDNLIVKNPDLGKGLVAGLGASGTSGRPGFGWFFGGDAYINSFSLVSVGAFLEVREALAFTQKWQREDGKMAHELSQAEGYIDWWNNYPFGYIHADTTPYYIVAMYEYLENSGDEGFIKESWDSLKQAYEWCLSTDANSDGLMDNKEAGLGALEYGALTGIQTDVYLAAIWTQACHAMQNLAKVAGDNRLEKEIAEDYLKAKKAFNEKFWDEEKAFYVYAFNAGGEKVKEISPWNALGLLWDLGTADRSMLTFEKLNSPEITTDWGVRSLSNQSPYYDPLGYNYGAVWPFLTSWVASAQFKHLLHLQGYSSLLSNVRHTFDHALGCLTEVFSGDHYAWLEEAVAHQGFSSAGVVLPFVRGLLGLEGNALEKAVIFAPQFPADWKDVCIKNYRIGEAIFSFDYKRNPDTLSVFVQSQKAEGFRLQLGPALGIGSQIKSLEVDGEPWAFETRRTEQAIQVKAVIPVDKESITIKVEYTPTVEILPPSVMTKVGERNKGLKIISVKKEGSELRVRVEGIADEKYELSVMNEELIKTVEGAELEADKLKIQMPEGKMDTFVPHKIVMHISEPES